MFPIFAKRRKFLILIATFFLAVGILLLLSRRPANIYVEPISSPEAPLDLSVTKEQINSSPQTSLVKSFADYMLQIAEGKLLLLDRTGKQLAEISPNVINASFVDATHVYYQTTGSAAGIYRYRITDGQNLNIIYSYDPLAFNNVVFVDDTNYFFIQPTTGKMGYGVVGSTSTTTIAEKRLNTKGNFTQAGAFAQASLSPDRKLIAVYDLNVDSDSLVKVLLFDASSKKAEPVAEFSVAAPLNSSQDRSSLSWSNDAQFLLAGGNAAVIDITNKRITYKSSDAVTSSFLSPDKKSLAQCTVSSCEIVNLQNQTKNSLSYFVKDLEWVNNQKVLLVSGEFIYTLDLISNTLLKVDMPASDYRLVGQVDDKFLVSSPNKIILLTIAQ